jgi:hypothetical protein
MSNIDPLALWFLFVFAVFVPYRSIRSSGRVRAGAVVPPRTRIFVNVLIMQASGSGNGRPGRGHAAGPLEADRPGS